MQIQISWLLQKPPDLDLHCLQRQGICGFSRTRVKRCIHIKISLPYLPWPKYWDTLTSYHTCPKIWNTMSSFYHFLICIKYWCMYGKQCRPWSDAAFGGIWSRSTLFVDAYLSQYLLCFWHLSENCFLLGALDRWSKFANFCHDLMLTLKTPRKSASENVVCLCRLLKLLVKF